MTTGRAAIAQLRSTSDKVSNLVDVAKCAGWAKKAEASMLFLPECFGFIGESAEQTLANAEPPIVVDSTSSSSTPKLDKKILSVLAETVSSHADGTDRDITDPKLSGKEGDDVSLLEGLKAIARESNLWISGGGMHESGAPPLEEMVKNDKIHPRRRVYNSHVILDSNGTVRSLYRKIHLFDVSVPGPNGVQLRESDTTAPGSKLVVCKDSPLGTLGLSTCYDVRFPEMYIDLVERGGAEVLLVPSAFTVPTGTAHWHTLLRSRAIESQCYVLAAAQYGRHNSKRVSYGHSIAIDPWGRVIADAGGFDDNENKDQTTKIVEVKVPSIITCDIDSNLIQSIRQRIPIRLHRESSEFSF